jgi:hypothetical protein
MIQKWALRSVLCCSLLTGCAGLDRAGVLSESSRSQVDGDMQPGQTFDIRDPEQRKNALAAINHESIRIEILNTPKNSLVNIAVDFDRSFLGTFVQYSSGRVVLTNCLFKDRVPAPDGREQCRTNHIPVHSLDISRITCFSVLAAGQSRSTSDNEHHRPLDIPIDSIVLKSGRRVTWFEPKTPSDPDDGFRQRMTSQIAHATAGSQVSLIDNSGRPFNGILLNTADDRIQMINCISRIPVSKADGQTVYQTSHIPIHSIPRSNIQSFEIVSLGKADFVAPVLDVDCEEFIATEFVSQSGQRIRWGKPIFEGVALAPL